MTIDTVLGLIGVALAVASIAISLYLYFHDVRKRLDLISDRLRLLLEAQQIEVSQIKEEFATSTYALLEKQDDALERFHDEILARLLQVEQHQEGIISGKQVVQLTNLYLDPVSTHLDLELTQYMLGALPGKFKAKQIKGIMDDIVSKYDSVVRRSIRPMVSHFKLRNEQSFDDFVVSIKFDAVKSAFELIENKLADCLKEGQDYKTFVVATKEILRSVNDEGRTRMLVKIEQIYPTTMLHR